MTPERLGTTSFPSGDLLLIDFGLLRMWSGDRPPTLDEGLAPPEVVARANESVDFEIIGPDAATVVAELDLAVVKGRYAFDLPSDGEPLQTKVADACRRRRLEAGIRPVGRLPHRQRVLRLLDDNPAGAEVPFHGPWGVAVRGVPRDRPLSVLGERLDATDPDAGRWHSVWIDCGPGEVSSSVEAGYVLVDEARLMFADPTALSAWRNDEPVDELFDLAFWGRDADTVADASGAALMPGPGQPGVFGWTDLAEQEVVSEYRRLEALLAEGNLRIRIDVRPHDDHYRVLSEAYSSATESGTVDVGSALMCGFFTSWGDGAFPVYCDRAADGTLLRVRVELGAPEIVQRTRRFERLWFGDLSQQAIVSVRVARDGAAVGWLYREAADRDEDSGWRVFAGDESQEYLDDPGNAVLMPLRELISSDTELEILFNAPSPAAFERNPGGTFSPTDPPEIE